MVDPRHLHLQATPPRGGGGFSVLAHRTSIAIVPAAPRGYAPGARPAASVVTYGRSVSAGHSRNRLKSFSRLVEAFERDEIEAGVELLIAALDSCDGDPDLEPNGDELDAGIPEGWHGIASLDPAQLAHEDAEDDDSDRCAAHDDHGGENVETSDNALCLPGDPDDAEDGDDDRCLAGDDGCGAIMDAASGGTIWGSQLDGSPMRWNRAAIRVAHGAEARR